MTTASRPCKRCGMPIVFVENEATGAVLPLQKLRTIYTFIGGANPKARKLDLANPSIYVSHFETCPKAGEFRRKNR